MWRSLPSVHHPALVSGATALALAAAACAGGGTASPFHPGASERGYTVVYDPRGLPPHVTDGPCVQLSPNAGLRQAEKGMGQVDCTGSGYGLDVEETRLEGNLIAVWGTVPAGATAVTVARRAATVKDHTYLAVMPRPAGKYSVVAQDRSGRPIATFTSDRLPPSVPNFGPVTPRCARTVVRAQPGPAPHRRARTR
jgi:hypothetical protein